MRQGATPVPIPNTMVKTLPADDTRPRGPGKQEAARINGGVAQLGEHLPCKQGVKSSNLSVSIQTEMSAYCTLKTSYRKRIDYQLIIKTSKFNRTKTLKVEIIFNNSL